MRTRMHQRFSHSLEPGHDSDIDCGACQLEAAHGISPKIADSDPAKAMAADCAGRAGRAAGEKQGTDCISAWIRWAESQNINTANPVSAGLYMEFAIAYCEEAKLRLEHEIAALKAARRHFEQD